MSAWGTDPWESDVGADWFLSLFGQCDIVDYVDRTLKNPPLENIEELRAAAFLLRQLGRNYIWPPEHRERQVKLAVEQLRKGVEWGQAHPDEMDDWLIEALREEMSALEALL